MLEILVSHNECQELCNSDAYPKLLQDLVDKLNAPDSKPFLSVLNGGCTHLMSDMRGLFGPASTFSLLLSPASSDDWLRQMAQRQDTFLVLGMATSAKMKVPGRR